MVIRQDGCIVDEHRCSFGHGQTVYNPWHDVSVLARKHGALCNFASPSRKGWPAAMEWVRHKLAGIDDGSSQIVDILAAVLTDGRPVIDARVGLAPSFIQC